MIQQIATDQIVTITDASGTKQQILFGLRKDLGAYEWGLTLARYVDGQGWVPVYTRDVSDGRTNLVEGEDNILYNLRAFVKNANIVLDRIFGAAAPDAEAPEEAFRAVMTQHLKIANNRFVEIP